MAISTNDPKKDEAMVATLATSSGMVNHAIWIHMDPYGFICVHMGPYMVVG